MTTIARGGTQKLTPRQQRGRAVNAVAEVLRKKLLVPHIYLEPRSHSVSADVLAVDRAGSGDLHAVEIRLGTDFRPPQYRKPTNATQMNQQTHAWMQHMKRVMKKAYDHLISLPAHYKYLAIPQDSWDLLFGEIAPHLYRPDGIGRIGLIAITDRGGEPPTAEISIAPERFRVDAAKLGKVERNLVNNKKVRPDIEVRI